MKKFTSSEQIWLILFVVVIIGLMAGCMMSTVKQSGTWGPRPSTSMMMKVDHLAATAGPSEGS
jgi:hypothetical protein